MAGTWVLGAGALVGLTWGGWLALERGSLAALLADLGTQYRREQHLDTTMQESLQRLAEQRQVAQEVLAGRLTLLQAAARFRTIRAEDSPHHRALALRHYPGASEEEWLCRLVIGFVAAELQGQPEQERACRQRLEAELRQHLRRGPLRLR
jgi:hypothetical protein